MSNRVPAAVARKFEVYDWRNALALLAAVHPDEWDEILEVLSGFVLRWSEVARGGGNKSAIAKRIDGALEQRGWFEKSFDTRIKVDDEEHVTPTHSIDCYKNRVALEVEWNNKDPFFDRDLNNFRLLYELRVIDVGVIVTRTTALQTVLISVGRNTTTFGMATTHTQKLYPKIIGGGAGGCPVVVFGIKPEAFVDDR
jgi:hypothetical protein